MEHTMTHPMSLQKQQLYIEVCVDALEPFGDLLEVGFGGGLSPSHIQSYFPKSHTIIEPRQKEIVKAREWVTHYTHIHLIETPWEESLYRLGVFDAIFLNEDPLIYDHKEDRLFSFFEQCLSGHMRRGSRLSCCLYDPTSKYQDRIWLEKVLSSPFLDCQERKIPVDRSICGSSPQAVEALVITIIKK